MLKDKKTNEQQNQETPQEQMKLDDARRVKVLSPGMLVFKRFIRNKLAVTGIIILAFMFTFAFLGPVFSPYSIAKIFTKEITEPADYASGKVNRDSRLYGLEDSAITSGLLKELGKHKSGDKYKLEKDEEFAFTAGKTQYVLKVVNPDPERPTCEIYENMLIATSKGMGDDIAVTFTEGLALEDGLKAAIEENAVAKNKGKEIDYNGMIVSIVKKSKVEYEYYASFGDPVAISTFYIYTALRGKVAELQSDAAFLHNVNTAIQSGEESVSASDGAQYQIVTGENGRYTLANSEGTDLFLITRVYQSGEITVAVPKAEGSEETEDQQVDFITTVSDAAAFREVAAAAVAEADAAIALAKAEAIADNESEENVQKAMIAAGDINFTFDEQEFRLMAKQEDGALNGEYTVFAPDGQPGMTVLNDFDPIETKYDLLNSDFRFMDAAEHAIADSAATIEYDGETYSIEKDAQNNFYTVRNAAGENAVLISEIAYGAVQNGTELTVDFILKLQDSIWNKRDEFVFINQYGEETTALLHISNENNYVRTYQKKTLLDTRAPLSGEHIMGTDIYAMDVLTRLMYGGRISLLVGFVVIFFEIIIGVIIGGISGYFGGVVDTILMRFVELFNAIPFYPMLIILGSVMDNLHVSSTPRLMLTMAILGILGWTGIARTVRGQILSLREQDFMVATEATGIRTSRRIFKHLVPNVMPLMIVYATAGLGGIILTEATLGFLGLGVKYPMASWGSIINQATDMQVMSTNWWIWIPAGTLILLTVLGFNFVGDGLRDAFDPKMKR